jgi:Flp pilus assembly protein TadG
MTRSDVRVTRRRNERGAAMLEVALTIPIILLICVGIFEFGRAFQTWQVLTNAAREGARVSITPDATVSDVQSVVTGYMVSGSLSNYAGATINVNRGATISVNGVPTLASQVVVNYPYSFMVLQPVIRLISPSSTTGAPITMVATAVMRNESQ